MNILEVISSQWDKEIVPQLIEYIRIPAKSPAFDPDWAKHGYIDAAIKLAYHWVKRQNIAGLQIEIVQLTGRTPVLLFDVPATHGRATEPTVLLYGHLDKQPEMSGWREGFGPWTPVIEDGKLYGRGGADDGYAVFAALSAINAMDAQGVARPRCIGLIECCEESGSFDLPAYLDFLAPRMGRVALVIALDSGCGNYEQLWVTTSLRGLVNGTLKVDVLSEGVHSGDAGGVVPSSFRIIRALLERIDDMHTGHVHSPDFHCAIPNARITQAKQAAAILGDVIWRRFPWTQDSTPPHRRIDLTELILQRTWRASLAVTGADGLPPLNIAGNVLRPGTALKLSLRLPPLITGEEAAEKLKQTLEADPPYQAKVSFTVESTATGWNAPETAPWLSAALDTASKNFYDRPAAYIGEGGTIPFMSMLGEKFPQAQMVVTGVLGPKSNAHGPNEFLHLPYAKRLTAAVTTILQSMPR